MYWNQPLYRYDWPELNSVFEEFNRVFGNLAGGRTGYPRLNAWVNEDGAEIAVELPGVDPNDLEITVEDNVLTLKGEKKAPEVKDDEIWHRNERASGSFTRELALPFRVAPGSVKAAAKNGIVTIKLEREAADRPRKIKISAA